MLQNTAILKVGGGLAAVGATAGAGYFAHTQDLFIRTKTPENTSAKDYLIVRSTKHTSTAEGEIYDYAFFSSTKKNFQCVTTISSEIVDTDCEIYKLSNDEKKLAKAIENNFGANSTNIKEENNYFKITSPKLIDAITKWEHETEQLIQITQTDKTKVFAKLTPVYKVKNGEIVARKTSFLYAKVDDSGTSITQPNEDIKVSTDKNYQCQLTINTKIDCSIVELTLESSKKTIDISGNANPTKTNLKTKDKHFRIEMQEKHLNKFHLSNEKQTIDIVATNPTNGQKYAHLTTLFTMLDKEISGNDNFLLLLSTATTENNGDSTTTGYNQCTFVNLSKQINCEIYKFKTPQTTITNISFDGGIEKTDSNSDIKNTNHFVMKISKTVFDINKLKPKTTVELSTANAGDKKYTLTVEKRLFIDPTPNATPLTVNSVHLLDI